MRRLRSAYRTVRRRLPCLCVSICQCCCADSCRSPRGCSHFVYCVSSHMRMYRRRLIPPSRTLLFVLCDTVHTSSRLRWIQLPQLPTSQSPWSDATVRSKNPSKAGKMSQTSPARELRGSLVCVPRPHRSVCERLPDEGKPAGSSQRESTVGKDTTKSGEV